MRIERREHGTDVYVRQSWINDALMCGERGRQAILRPEWSLPNDATIMGTAVHAGIEAHLTSGRSAKVVGLEALRQLMESTFKRTKFSDDEMLSYVMDMCDEWEANIKPLLGKVLYTEQDFHFQLDQFDLNGEQITVYGKGTVDCVTETGLWDWKTASRKYNAREKQSQAIQPTMYAAAAVALGWHTYPVTFNYGVMVRGGKSQIVSVHRNESHTDWLKEVVRPLVRTAVAVGTDDSWSKNDTHFLCSETWCPWWSICKGSKLSPEDITPKEQS